MAASVTDTDTLISEIIPNEEIKILERGRLEEILQPLRDLGYLPNANESLLDQGIRQFRKDYLSLDLIPDFVPKFLFLPNTELEGEELNLLHTLTALDGDFILKTLPQPGEVSLCSRVIHYRLTIHELFSGTADLPFSHLSIEAIKRPSTWINNLPQNPLDLINWLGDVPQLIRHIAKDVNGNLNKKIVAFKYQKASSVSPFMAPIPKSTKSEILEEEDDDDLDEQELKNKELEMLKLETEIDDEIEMFKQEPIFDPKEQRVLEEDTKKNKNKRLKLEQVQAMLVKTHGEILTLNDTFNAKSIELKSAIDEFEKLQSQLGFQKRAFVQAIEMKNEIIKDQHAKRKTLNSKKERVATLNRKKQTRRRKRKIKELNEEILRLKPEVVPLSVTEKIEFEVSDINLKLILINIDLDPAESKLKGLKKAFQKHLDNREDFFSDKQKEIQKTHAQLKILEAKVNKLRFSFRGRMRRALDKTFYDEVVRKEIFQKRNRQVLEKISSDDYNKYLIRLIQIFQWTNGYYYGKLDSEIGDRTFSALDDMSNYSKRLRLKFILSKLSDRHDGTKGFWILNVNYLFDHLSDFIKENDKSITTYDLLEAYEKEFLDEDGKAGKIGNEVTDKGYQELVKENEQDIKGPGIIRRIYYGIRSIAKTLLNALSDLIRLIKRGVKKLIYLVKNLIKVVYKEIREGVRKFKSGMHFLFGHRIFETKTSDGSAIITKFDFDFDAITFAPKQVNQLNQIEHTTKLYSNAANLNFTMVLTGQILKWVFKIIQLSSPIGWARLAIKIAIYYKRLIIKWLIKLGKNIRQHFIEVKYKAPAH